jgi:hypothetical protein
VPYVRLQPLPCVLSKSLFVNRLVIRRCIVWGSDTVVKYLNVLIVFHVITGNVCPYFIFRMLLPCLNAMAVYLQYCSRYVTAGFDATWLEYRSRCVLHIRVSMLFLCHFFHSSIREALFTLMGASRCALSSFVSCDMVTIICVSLSWLYSSHMKFWRWNGSFFVTCSCSTKTYLGLGLSLLSFLYFSNDVIRRS